MLRYFRRLEARAQELGNQRRKYLHGIDKHGRLLVDRLEESGCFDRVHLRRPAGDLGAEMDDVLEAGRDEQEKLLLLGCFYAIQFLFMNIRSIDLLRLNVSGTTERSEVYTGFLRGVGDDFEKLSREYLSRLLRLFLADAPTPEYVVCMVGTRLHQDDVDLGIFDSGGPGRAHLNRAIGRMASEMMRWSSAPDFYLSEHVGREGYSVSIEEYRKRIDRRILDFVSVSEMLGAHPIVGSPRLFDRFKAEVLSRYSYQRRKSTREHEGYVRGLAGEMRSLLLRPLDTLRINPKDDFLRLVISFSSAYRVIHQIPESEIWSTFEQDYTFVETFRHLYQQFAAQDEEINLEEPQVRENLQQVAGAMGYDDVGVIRAWEQLIVHYFEHVKAGRETVRGLLPEIRDHIRSISVFFDWFRMPGAREDDPAKRPNLAVDFVYRVRYFKGIKFWDDLLEVLDAEESGLLGWVLDDLKRLSPNRRERVLEHFARWGHRTFLTILRFLTMIGRKAREHDAVEIFEALNRAVLEKIQGTPDEVRRFSTVFIHYPDLIYRYLTMIDEKSRRYLADRLSGEVWDPQVAGWRDRFLGLCEIDRKSSRFFKRAINRVCEKNPEYLLHFDDLEKLAQINRGMLADLMRVTSYETRKLELISYYDVEFLRIGLATLQGRPLAELDAEFTDFADHFLQTMFDVCKNEVDEDVGRRIATHDLLGLFVAGGHGRERAHQDDWDLIVLLNSDDREIFDYSNRIITHLNRAIVRCGIIPQYRLADRFGAYVTRLSELETYLASAGSEACIDMSQLVGARLVVGSSRLEEHFRKKILKGCIHSRKDLFVRALVEEIRSRHTHAPPDDGPDYDIKECRGGLRDLEMSQLLWKVACQILEPIGGRFWDVLADHRPERRAEFRELRESYEFLNRLRDVYRLTVSPHDRLDPGQFHIPAEILGYEASQGLAADYRKHTSRVAGKLDELIERLAECG